jgi:hypothetical protein
MSRPKYELFKERQGGGVELRDDQLKFIVEYEKYKDVKLEIGSIYSHKNKNSVKYEILSIDEPSDVCEVETLHSEVVLERTLHWCRKNLILVG